MKFDSLTWVIIVQNCQRLSELPSFIVNKTTDFSSASHLVNAFEPKSSTTNSFHHLGAVPGTETQLRRSIYRSSPQRDKLTACPVDVVVLLLLFPPPFKWPGFGAQARWPQRVALYVKTQRQRGFYSDTTFPERKETLCSSCICDWDQLLTDRLSEGGEDTDALKRRTFSPVLFSSLVLLFWWCNFCHIGYSKQEWLELWMGCGCDIFRP